MKGKAKNNSLTGGPIFYKRAVGFLESIFCHNKSA
ncbi:hypothetical protein NEOC65_002191 [Neochlamydia sp. AcF65]|nr:hypothetical protein [Neochlamydia sp. AcF65]MBS4170773.1 hypothetical protein [Neochlamydia sp. AcF95]